MLTFNPQFLSANSIGEYTWHRIGVRENPSATTYLEFAEADFADGQNDRCRVNAISNAKRSLHMRLEDLCLGFGSVTLSKLKTFPFLLNYVRKCGIVTPKVLVQLNLLRNDVEHRFQVPTASEVTTFIGVASLFLSATDRWIDRQPVEIDYFKEVLSDGEIWCLVAVKFDWKQGLTMLHFRKKGESLGSRTRTVKFTSPSDEFFHCVNFALTNNY